MRTPARASAFADSLRLGDMVIGLFTARWVLAALGKTDFGLYGVVGGMMGIELLACTMRPTATGLPQRNFHYGV